MPDTKLIDKENDFKVFERVFNLLYDLLEESAFKKYDSSKEKFLGPVLVGAYEVIIPGLIKYLDFYEESDNHPKLVSLIKCIYNQDQYIDAIKRGVRPVTRLKKLAQFSREFFKYED